MHTKRSLVITVRLFISLMLKIPTMHTASAIFCSFDSTIGNVAATLGSLKLLLSEKHLALILLTEVLLYSSHVRPRSHHQDPRP